MRTIKLQIDTPELDHHRRVQSYTIRRGYEWIRSRGIPKQNEPRLQPQEQLDGHLIRSGLIRAKELHDTRPERMIFGGRKNIIRRAKNLITNIEWKALRTHPLYSVGQANCKGNRKFRLDMSRRVLVYRDEWNRYEWAIPKQKSNYERLLIELDQRARTGELSLTFSVGPNSCSISFDEQKLIYYSERYSKFRAIPGRSLGIDLNPDRIGIAIRDKMGRLVHAEYFENRHRGSGKKRQEWSLVCDAIYRLLRHHRCERIVVEELSVKSKDHGGRKRNRIINSWIRNFIINKLKLISGITGCNLVEVNPAYSSFIGNILNPELGDPCCAALEVARRGSYKYIKSYFYPPLVDRRVLADRWKETEELVYSSWVELYGIFKNLRLGWRTSSVQTRSSRFGSSSSGTARIGVSV